MIKYLLVLLYVTYNFSSASVQCSFSSDVSCDSYATCCQIDFSGDYACCPYTDGVCCVGTNNCCPAGSACTADGCNFDDSMELFAVHTQLNKPLRNFLKHHGRKNI